MVQARVDSRNPDYMAASYKRNSNKNNDNINSDSKNNSKNFDKSERGSPSKGPKKTSFIRNSLQQPASKAVENDRFKAPV